MTLQKAYQYLYYKLYKSFEAVPSRWWSEWKASLGMDALIIFLLISAKGYYKIVTKTGDLFGHKIVLWIIGLTVVVINYFIFNHNDDWKKFVEEFDKLPKRKNTIGTILAWIVVLLIFANLIFMYYLMSKIDWKEYR